MRIFQSMKFRVQIIVVLVFTALLMTVYTSISFYELSTREFRKMSSQLTENITEMTAANLTEYFDVVSKYTQRILAAPSLRRLAQSGAYGGDPSAYASTASIVLRGSVTEAIREDVHFRRTDIHLINGNSISSSGICLEKDYAACLAALADCGFSCEDGYIGTQWGLTNTGNGEPVLTCVRFLYDELAYKIGVAVFQLSDEDILSLFSNIQGAYLLGQDGVVLTGSTGEMQNNALLAAVGDLSSSGSLVETQGFSSSLITYSPVISRHILLVVPVEAYEEVVYTQTADYSRSIVLTLLLGVLLSIAIARILSESLSRSVTSLTDFINSTGDIGTSNTRYKVTGTNEIAQIGKTVNEMLDKLQLAYRLREADIKAQQALELNLLRSQINPHLLYNSLNSALWAIQSDKGEEAAALITDMSEYFKLALSGGHQIITLEEELKLIGHYLRIQQLARHRAVELKLDIPPALYSHPIMKLTLQPIVENAVIHGLDGYRTDGIISISAERDGRLLRIRVRDNGIGIEPDELEALRRSLLANPSENTGRSFGLYCINRSLCQAGGAECGLTIESEVSEYTIVTATMPYAGQEDCKDV